MGVLRDHDYVVDGFEVCSLFLSSLSYKPDAIQARDDLEAVLGCTAVEPIRNIATPPPRYRKMLAPTYSRTLGARVWYVTKTGGCQFP